MKRLLAVVILVFSFASCEDILEVTDISTEQVELLAPIHQSIVTDSLVNFNWNGVNEADSYLIQIATPNFDNASQLVLDSIIVIDTTFQGTRVAKMLSNNAYEWRVKALNSGFETDFSNSRFSVDVSSN